MPQTVCRSRARDSIRFLMRVNQEGKKRNQAAENQQRDGHRLEGGAAETGLQQVVEMRDRRREKWKPAAVGEVVRADGQCVKTNDADGSAEQELHIISSKPLF